MSSRGLPALSSDAGLSRYLSEIRKFPLLTPEDEYMFAKRLKEHGDAEAARRLVTSHLRLVAKIAMGYRGYGLPISEIVSEGNIGLMQAVKRFEPDKGFRLATYAMWWIRASIQEYVLRSWSMVKLGTTAAQKKLFFNLRKAKSNIGAIEEGDLTPAHTTKLADQLGVTEREVTDMNRRLSGPDSSLNAPLRSESESEWQDWLADDTMDQETRLAEREELGDRHSLLSNAMDTLTERERDIIQARRLQEEPITLEDLSQKYGVSRERVRQIEVRAFEKLQKAMSSAAQRSHPAHLQRNAHERSAVMRRKQFASAVPLCRQLWRQRSDHEAQALAGGRFADKPRVLEGNPAAVVPLENWLDDGLMQKIAGENNLAETAFFVKTAPAVMTCAGSRPIPKEVELCGHATLASAFVIFQALDPSLHEVPLPDPLRRTDGDARRQWPQHVMSLPSAASEPFVPPPDFAAALGAALGGRRQPNCISAARRCAGAGALLAVWPSPGRHVKALKPDGNLEAVLLRIEAGSLLATAQGDGKPYDFVSRFFAPHWGVPEGSRSPARRIAP